MKSFSQETEKFVTEFPRPFAGGLYAAKTGMCQDAEIIIWLVYKTQVLFH